MRAYELVQIDIKATGENIKRLRIENGFSVKDLQDFFGFSEPQAIYKWQWGKTLPSIDNFFALSKLFNTSIDSILVAKDTVIFLIFFILNFLFNDFLFYLY